MKKIAIIPAFNEEESILKTVADLQKNAPDKQLKIKDRTGEKQRLRAAHISARQFFRCKMKGFPGKFRLSLKGTACNQDHIKKLLS